MSKESEKAAKWDMVQDLKAERSRLSVLQQKAETTGKDLEDLGRVFSNPSWNFRVEGDHILGNSTIAQAVVATRLESLDKEKIIALITDLAETQGRIRTLEERLRQAGL